MKEHPSEEQFPGVLDINVETVSRIWLGDPNQEKPDWSRIGLESGLVGGGVGMWTSISGSICHVIKAKSEYQEEEGKSITNDVEMEEDHDVM